MTGFASLGQNELEEEKEAYRLMNTTEVKEALALLRERADTAWAKTWSEEGQDALYNLEKALNAVRGWKAALEEDVL